MRSMVCAYWGVSYSPSPIDPQHKDLTPSKPLINAQKIGEGNLRGWFDSQLPHEVRIAVLAL